METFAKEHTGRTRADNHLAQTWTFYGGPHPALSLSQREVNRKVKRE